MLHIRSRIARIFFQHALPLVTVVLALGLCASSLAHFMVGRSSREEAKRVLDDAILYYDNVFDEMDSLSLMLGMNNELLSRIRHILSRDEVDLNGYRDLKLVLASLSSPAGGRSYVSSIYLYIDNPWHLVFSSDGMYDARFLSNRSWLDWYANHPTGPVKAIMPVTLENGSRIIRMIWRFSNAATNQKGLIILDLRSSDLEAAYAGHSGALIATLDDGQMLLKTKNPGEKVARFQAKSEKYGLTYTYALDLSRLYSLSRTLMWLTLVLTFVALLVGLAITLKVNRRERKFLANVLAQFSQVGSTPGDEDFSEDVFEYLNYHVIKTFLEQDYIKWQKEAMEFRALQMQVNPHFLFNTLDTIHWKAIRITGGENEVSRMLLLLSRLLKYSLTAEEEGVPLWREMEVVEDYIALQHYRFKDRFSFHEEIDSSLREMRVPAMFLEPLLENSFNHGFVPNRTLGISFSARPLGEGIAELLVSDDGMPLDQEKLEKLNAGGSDVLKRSTSLGLCNTRKRFLLYSGGAASLRVESDGKQGVTIRIRMPIRFQV